MSPANEFSVFVSYASPDQDRVLPVYEYLVNQGFNPWMDAKEIMPGQQWDFEIKRALKRAEIILIFLSNQSVDKRGYVQRELKKALKYLEEKHLDDIYIIPVKLDSDVTVPDLLEDIHWINLDQADSLGIIAKSISRQYEKLGYQKTEIQRVQELNVSKKIVKESWDGLPGYEVELAIPIIYSDRYKNIGEVTSIIEGRLISTLQMHRSGKLSQSPDIFSWTQDRFFRSNTFDASFSHSVVGSVLSIVYSVDWYGAGAAHPNQHFESYNFILEPLHQITRVSEIFIDQSTAFPILQELIRNQLRGIKWPDDSGEESPLLEEDWILRGTENWQSLSESLYEEDGITFFFAPYQVGPYVIGPQTVKIPYDDIRDFMTKDVKAALAIGWF